jgi:Tfp pilus assembly protein PilO
MAKQTKATKNYFVDHYIFITVFCSLLTLVLLYFFVVSQAFVEFREVRRVDIAEEQERLESLRSDLQLLKRLESNFATINDTTIAEIESVVPKEADLPNLFVNLDGIAKASGNEISTVSFNKSTQREKIGLGRIFGETEESVDTSGTDDNLSAYPFTKLYVLVVELDVLSNSYSDFKQFIQTVEKNIRIMDIIDFNYNPLEASFRVRLETYYIGSGADE